MNNKYKIIKEEHKWTSEEKIKFCGYGEWVEELDFIEFEYKGYRATVIRRLLKEPCAEEECWFGGHLCGYVKIPNEYPPFEEEEIDLECHGGITFEGIMDEEHWIGFDCGHAGDLIPTMMQHFKNDNLVFNTFQKLLIETNPFSKFPALNHIYRNMNYCTEECMKIIDWLREREINPQSSPRNYLYE